MKRDERTFDGIQHSRMYTDRNNLLLFYRFELEQNVSNNAMLYIQNIPPTEKTKGDFNSLFLNNKKEWYAKKAVKQVFGVDVAQDELIVCLGKMYE